MYINMHIHIYIQTFARSFVVSYEEYGTIKTHPLKPGGDDIPVTNANRHEYVQQYIKYLLEDSIALQVALSTCLCSHACAHVHEFMCPHTAVLLHMCPHR